MTDVSAGAFGLGCSGDQSSSDTITILKKEVTMAADQPHLT
jgi:hypothetical protein